MSVEQPFGQQQPLRLRIPDGGDAEFALKHAAQMAIGDAQARRQHRQIVFFQEPVIDQARGGVRDPLRRIDAGVAGSQFRPAAQAGAKARSFGRCRTGKERAASAHRRLGGANGATIDSGRGHADEELSVEARVSGQERAVAVVGAEHAGIMPSPENLRSPFSDIGARIRPRPGEAVLRGIMRDHFREKMQQKTMTRARRHRRLILLATLSVIVALPAGCSWIDVKEREFIFRPVKDDFYGYSADTDQAQVKIPVGADGDFVSAWWMPAPSADAPALLFLHGARWNLTGSARRIARYRQLGFSVLAIDYRGFGKSSGDVPSEDMAYEDARAAWQRLLALAPNARHYVYGHSLGGAIAIEVARNNPQVDGLILESTFTSIRDMARQYAWGWLPVGLVLTQRFDSLEKIGEVRAPTLFVHGKEDRLVPSSMSEQLFAASRAAKRLVLVDGAGHSNIAWTASFNNVGQAVHSFFGIPASVDASTR